MVTQRLQQHVRKVFETAMAGDALLELLSMVDESGDPVSERIQAAAVVFARGDLDRLAEARQLARIDWRDLLVVGGLAYEDWPDRLDELLGPEQ
jgi:hypothetical protein